ncbi:class I tRNA ligase family protein, partial [Natronospira sp.]
ELSLPDRWILSRLERTVNEVTTRLDEYRLDLAAKALYEFTWNEYCDWYLELSKPVLQSENSSDAARRGTRRTLVQVLETLLRPMHPVMPFISEEIWQRVAPLAGAEGETIMYAPWPTPAGHADSAIESEMDWLQGFILGVRRIRGEMDISPNKPLDVLLANSSERDRTRLENHHHLLSNLARLETVTVLEADSNPPESATALLGEMEILVPMAGLIDKEAELARLEKELAKIRKGLEQAERKLANEKFVSNAPAEVVDKERGKAEEMRAALERLDAKREKIAAL